MYPSRIWWEYTVPPIIIPGEPLDLLYAQMSQQPLDETLAWLSMEEG